MRFRLVLSIVCICLLIVLAGTPAALAQSRGLAERTSPGIPPEVHEWDGVLMTSSDQDAGDAGSESSNHNAGSAGSSAGLTPLSLVHFDDAYTSQCVNTLYADYGIMFERDDGYCVHAECFSCIDRSTPSSPNGICTTLGPGSPTYVPHLNILFSAPANQMGFYLGNDHLPDMTWLVEVFRQDGTLIGSLSITTNGNMHVDEFIGFTSDEPFWTVRVSQPDPWYSVCVDDVTFSLVDDDEDDDEGTDGGEGPINIFDRNWNLPPTMAL